MSRTRALIYDPNNFLTSIVSPKPPESARGSYGVFVFNVYFSFFYRSYFMVVIGKYEPDQTVFISYLEAWKSSLTSSCILRVLLL